MLSSDIHSHLMPGVDDGSRSPVETVAMARGLAKLGVRRVYLTPHQFKLGNSFTKAELQRRTADVARLLEGEGIPLEVCCGAEHFYGEDLLDAVAGRGELVTFDWEEAPCVLIELPMSQPVVGVRRVGEVLLRRGVRPVLAHPERTSGISGDLDRLHGWHEAGWSLQLNLLSLVGRHGVEAERVGRDLLERGLYDFVGSDLHHPADLPSLRDAHAAFRALTEGALRR